MGSDEIVANAVGSSEIAAGAVHGSEIADESIWWRDLGDIWIVSVECNSECTDANLGQVCDFIGSGYVGGKPIAVACRDVKDHSGSSGCGGDNECIAGTLSRGWNLGDLCEDTSGWDVVVTCLRDSS